MTEYKFEQTQASLERLKQTVGVLKAEVEARKNKEQDEIANQAVSDGVCLDALKETVKQTLQKIDETTAIIDEVLK